MFLVYFFMQVEILLINWFSAIFSFPFNIFYLFIKAHLEKLELQHVHSPATSRRHMPKCKRTCPFSFDFFYFAQSTTQRFPR